MSNKKFNKEQRRYIADNREKMSAQDIAKNLKSPVKDVEAAIRELQTGETPEKVHKALPLRKLYSADWLWGLPAFLLPLIIYTMTLCRTLYVGDSGEFSAQGAVLGIAHPPGYPMWIMMVKCAVTLFGFFEHPAARGAFLCALVAGATTYFLYVLLLKLSHYRTVALSGSLMFAFCYHFWSQALFSEVFILNVFFTVVTMLLMLLWSENHEQRYFLALFFVTAMAMAHHNLFLVMPLLYSYFIVCSLFKKWNVKWEIIYLFIYGFVGLILYVLAERLANLISLLVINQPLPPQDTFLTKFTLTILTFVPYTLALHWWHKRDKTWIYATLLFILGMCMYLYIPMRLANNPLNNITDEQRRANTVLTQEKSVPAMSWGYIQTTEDLYNHISRRQYGPLSPIPRVFPEFLKDKAIFGPLDIVKEQFAEYWIYFFRQFGSYKTHYSDPTLDHFNHQYKPIEGWPSQGHMVLVGLWTAAWFSMMLLGIWRLFRQNGKYFVLTLMAFLIYGPGMQAVLNYQTTNHSMYIIARFLIPSYMIAAIWIAFGAQQIMEWLKYGFKLTGLPPVPDISEEDMNKYYRNTQPVNALPEGADTVATQLSKPATYPLHYALCGAMVLMPFVPLASNYWHQNLSKNDVAYYFGMNILKSIPKDGKIFIIGDNPTFALGYLSYVENKFPPTQIYDEGENLFVPIFDFGKDKFRIDPMTHNRLKDIGRAKITMTSNTPVYYMSVQSNTPPPDDPTRYQDFPGFPQVKQLPSGIVYQAVRPGEKEPDYESTLEQLTTLDKFFYEMGTDYYTRELVSNYHFLIGRAYYQQYTQAVDPVKREELKKKAYLHFDKTSETGWDLDNMHINLANIWRNEGILDKATTEFLKAIETQPRKALSYFMLADMYRTNFGKTEEAVKLLEKGVSLYYYDQDANDAGAYYLLGALQMELAAKLRKGRDISQLTADEAQKHVELVTKASNNIETALRGMPQNYMAYQNLGEAYFWLGRTSDAVFMWEKVIQMNPSFYPAYANLAYYYGTIVRDGAKAAQYQALAQRYKNVPTQNGGLPIGLIAK